VEGAFEELLEVGQEGGIVDDQRRTGFAGGILEGGFFFLGESDNREVAGGGVLAQLTDGGGNRGSGREEVGQDDHGFFLFGTGGEGVGAGSGEDAIAEVLEPVDQLAAGEQFFVEDQRQRLRHATRLEQGLGKCKNFWEEESATNDSKWMRKGKTSCRRLPA